MSTRGSSASHAVFGLEAPLSPSAAAAAATARGESTCRAESRGAEESARGGEGCLEGRRDQARGHEAGAQEEALGWDGKRQQAGQGASGAGAAAADQQSWSKRWTRLPGVIQVRYSRLCCVVLCSSSSPVQCIE